MVIYNMIDRGYWLDKKIVWKSSGQKTITIKCCDIL